MIKGLIFDFGGVLTEPTSQLKIFCEDFAKKQGIDPIRFKITFLETWGDARIGNLSPDAFWHNIAAEYNLSPSKLRSEFLSFFKIDERALDFVKSLRKKYKIAIITNIVQDLFEYLDNKYYLSKYFSAIVTSYKMRTTKPDIAIYREVVKELGLLADECLYIDDMKDNLMSAQKTGMNTIHFKGLSSLKTELMMFGIKTL